MPTVVSCNKTQLKAVNQLSAAMVDWGTTPRVAGRQYLKQLARLLNCVALSKVGLEPVGIPGSRGIWVAVAEGRGEEGRKKKGVVRRRESEDEGAKVAVRIQGSQRREREE